MKNEWNKKENALKVEEQKIISFNLNLYNHLMAMYYESAAYSPAYETWYHDSKFKYSTIISRFYFSINGFWIIHIYNKETESWLLATKIKSPYSTTSYLETS